MSTKTQRAIATILSSLAVITLVGCDIGPSQPDTTIQPLHREDGKGDSTNRQRICYPPTITQRP